MGPLIATGSLTRSSLSERVAIVTGAGRGLGFETARALAWLGANVIIAEIDDLTGPHAAKTIATEMGEGTASFVPTDVGDPASLHDLVTDAITQRGHIDIVVNNATVAPFGPVASVPLPEWDASYRVNLRGPITLARLTIPSMIERGYGVFVALSSVGGAYMAPYEAMKTAQVEMASALAAELEGTGVSAFAIGPGQAMTPGLEAGVQELAPLYGLSPAEFVAMNAANQITVEEAGAGVAAAVALAERFHNTETASLAALAAAGIRSPSASPGVPITPLGAKRSDRSAFLGESAGEACRRVRATLVREIEGWQERGAFERRWMERDFGGAAGLRAEDALVQLDRLQASIDAGKPDQGWRVLLPALRRYYDHYAGLARSYAKDADQLRVQLEAIGAMRAEIERLESLLGR